MKIKINKKYSNLFLVILLVIGSFLLANRVSANFGLDLLGGVAEALIAVLGWVLTQIMSVLIYIAQYNNFIASPAVENGWKIVRDICNMFFVVILLIIAFATILRLENYSYKKWLPKLILMAVLINFSKTICGLLIDVAQVVMLTFVNAFKDVVALNFTKMLGISDWQSLEGIADVSAWEVAAAMVLAVIYVVISIIVITAMLAMLVMRIVMIWIYVVLSPLAYLLSAFPGGQSYASEWWKEFIKNLIVGPVLAFFIWLSFTALVNFNDSSLGINGSVNSDNDITNTSNCQKNKEGKCAFGTSSLLIQFVIAIGMLLGGLKITQEIGGAAGSVAGKVASKGKGLALRGAALAGGAALWTGKKLVTGDNYFARKAAKDIFKADFRPVTIAKAVKATFAKQKHVDEVEIRNRGMKNLEGGGWRSVVGGAGAGENWAEYFTEGFLGSKGLKRAAGEFSGYRGHRRKELKSDIDRIDQEIDGVENEAGVKEGGLKAERDKYITKEDKDIADKEIINLRENEREKSDKINEIKDRIHSGQIQVGDNESLKTLEEERTVIGKKITEKKEILDKKQVVDKDKNPDDYKKYEDLNAAIIVKEREQSKIKEQLFKVAPPKALEGRLEYRNAINESKTKFKDITNADELIQLFEDAVRRGNKFDQVAILEKLSSDANLNEIVNDKGYKADGTGVYKFLRNMENDHGEKRGLKQGGKGGFDESEILRIQNDLGEFEERVGHWETAKMAVMNNKGELVSSIRPVIKDGKFVLDNNGQIVFDDTDHVLAAAAEVMKLDPQKNVAMLNRLAMGGEDADGKFQISNLGLVLTKIFDSSGVFKAQANRIQNNLAINLSLPWVQEKMKQVGVSPEILDLLKGKGVSKETGSLRPIDVLNYIKNIKGDIT